MAKKSAAVKKSKPTLGEALMVYTKSSSHCYSLVQPEIVTIEGIKFLQGIQVTGKERHRMERKRTLIPFEHVASLIQFDSEDDLFSEPQPRNLPAPEEFRQKAILTSHEQQMPGLPNQNQQRHDRGRHHNNNHPRGEHSPRDQHGLRDQHSQGVTFIGNR